MKKTLLILSLFVCSSIVVKAQTITTADVASPGTTVYEAIDTLPSISVGTASASAQAWNMLSLATNSTDTLSFHTYASFPNPLFSTSNLVVKQGWQNDFAYAINSSSSLTILGNHGTVNISGFPTVVNQKFTPAEQIATFPFAYNSSVANIYRSKAKFYFGHTVTVGGNTVQVDSVRDHSTVNKTILVDAFGTLQTPLGTYNVIRTSESKITHDTVDAYVVLFPGFGSWQNAAITTVDTVNSFTWWANGLGYSLATATLNSQGSVKSVKWLLQSPVGIDTYTAERIENAYPNPAQNEITILTDASKQKSVEVFDMTGRKIDSFSITNSLTKINSSAYANGVYSYTIIGKDNDVMYRGKFSISK